MERAGESLRAALRRLRRPEKPLDFLAAVWPVAVGRGLAAHTRPLACADGVLKIAVGERQWQEQLEPMAAEVQAKINTWWGGTLVREVRLVPGKVDDPCEHWLGPVPGQASGSNNVAEGEGKLTAAPLGLEGALAGIADTQLRELVGRVAAQYLGSRKE